MNDCITIRHELSCFSVTEEPKLVTSKTGKEILSEIGSIKADIIKRYREESMNTI